LLQVDERWFNLGEKIARFLRNELWISRFELISKSWFYQVADTFELMQLEPVYTIPGFKILLRNKEKR
ncbi:MAG TPA: UDP-glucose 4-epimerase, partial [Candidatus Cloacimonas sp.]|nr:UDP-glucose 4-epimerase [Candidatus Cloacimonas sp.]